MTVARWNSIKEGLEGLRGIWRSGKTLGSIHTLGALHEGHGKVIEMAARENDYVLVTVYPNKAQLAPGSVYEYDPEADVTFAAAHGATHVLCPRDGEMYPDDYRTFLNQGDCYARLDGTVVPYLFKGMITMSVRWILFSRPTRTYWGLKDIGQAILVSRALKDFMIDTEVREVPCVRYRTGIAISSRLMNQKEEKIREFGRVYQALEDGRKAMAAGVADAKKIVDVMLDTLSPATLKYFTVKYVKVAKPLDFIEPEKADLPIILHIVVTDGPKNYFEGHLLRTHEDLMNGPPTIWLDDDYPPFAKP